MPAFRTQSSGRNVRLSDSAEAEGGEGAIHGVEGAPEVVAKVYKKGKGSVEKLKVMLRLGSPGPRYQSSSPMFSWPIDLLEDKRGRIRGFLMPRIKGVSLYSLLWPDRRAKDQPQLSRKGLYAIAGHLARTLEELHDEGHAANDLNATNVFVTEYGVTLIDCDSFEVLDLKHKKVYICTVGKPKYTPPEFQGQNYRDFRGGQAVDRFALATLIFQLLMAGMHPFAGRYPSQQGGDQTLGARIASGQWPYADWTRAEPRPASPPLSILPPPLQELFRACFVDGHKDPSKRPSAQQWHNALATALSQLRECSRGHHYGSHLSNCPWCSGCLSSQKKSGAGRWLEKIRPNRGAPDRSLVSPLSGLGSVSTPVTSPPAMPLVPAIQLSSSQSVVANHERVRLNSTWSAPLG